MLAEIGSPESKANNPEYLFFNENHQSVFFIFHRCHILVHVRSIFFLFTIIVFIISQQDFFTL